MYFGEVVWRYCEILGHRDWAYKFGTESCVNDLEKSKSVDIEMFA